MRTRRLVLQALAVMTCLSPAVQGFSVSPPSSSSSTTRTGGSDSGAAPLLYGVPGSGWTSPAWNWGSAVGTGHDCAIICRNKYGSRTSRAQLVRDLLEPTAHATAVDLEEVKLVLALAWQRGRWDGSDGGPNGGYGEVLSRMAEAVRYERGNVVECRRHLLADLQIRFATLRPSDDAMAHVMSLSASDEQLDASLLVCCGHVLQAMGFVERGL